MFASYRFALLRPLAILGAVLAMLALSGVHPAHGQATITVNNLSDDDIHNNNNCTLREAIEAANTNTKVDQCMGQGGGLGDVIEFNLGNGTPEIDIGTTMLPDITERVNIEGHSNGADKVLIHGPAGGGIVSGHNGLTIDAGAAGSSIDDLMINNFPDDGVMIKADEVTLLDDYIGADVSGVSAYPNQGFGVQVQGNGDQIGTNNGGACPYACSLIAGNGKANILLDGSSSGAGIEGSYIGTDKTGAGVMGSAAAVEGIIDKGTNNTIGGSDGTDVNGGGCAGDCNVMFGIPEAVLVDTGATNSVILGNYIGINGAGESPLVTMVSTWGVINRADGTRIGGTTPAARNVISGAKNANVLIGGHNALVEGNYIGMRADGTAAIGGTSWSVQAYQAVGAEIGGTTEGTPNVISGGGFANVDIQLSTGVQVQGNYIGTTPDGTELKPSNYNVEVENGSSDALIGGTTDGSGNTIAFAVHYGVDADNANPLVHDNTIRRNSIYSNGDAGIFLTNGANDGILPPAIAGVHPLTGTSCANCTVEIFSDAGKQGKKFEGAVTAAGSGAWTFAGSLSGPNVTATATDASSNTSQFSDPFVLSIQGDVNCDGFVDDSDFDYLLKYGAGLNNGMTSGCYSLGDPNAPGGFAWGDLNCDGFVNAVDVLYLLAYRAGILLAPVNQSCVPIGHGLA